MTIIDVLRRAEIETTILGVDGVSVQGAHDITVQADAPLAERLDEPWDLVVLPGGMPGSTNLRDSEIVQTFLGAQQKRSAKLAAICAAPIALSAAGVLAGHQATSYPGFADQLHCEKYREDSVVVDRQVITSRGPATALPFALHLVAQLRDQTTAANIGKAMLVPDELLPTCR